MAGLFGEEVALALFTVVSPLVFVALFLVLDTERPIRNGVAYVVGLTGAVAFTAVVAGFVMHGHVGAGTSTDQGISWFNLGLGVFELGSGLWLKFKGPRPGEVQVPAFVERLRRSNPAVIFGLGILVPTYPAIVSAGTALLRTSEGTGSRLGAVTVYVLLCAFVVGAPVAFVALRGEPAQASVRRASDWVLQRTSTVGAWILIAVGCYLIVNSLTLWR